MEDKQLLGLGSWQQGWQEVDFKDTKAQQSLAVPWMWCKETIQEQSPASALVAEAIPGTDCTKETRVWREDSVFRLGRICLKDLCDGHVHSWVVVCEVLARDLRQREGCD